jgi:hypothetical protein
MWTEHLKLLVHVPIKKQSKNQLNIRIFNLKVYRFLLNTWDELDVNTSKRTTGRKALWKSLFQGLVWLLAGFMASWEPMSEARSTTQEELEVVNIMWWIANISSTFWVISGSSTTVRTGWKGNLYDRRNIQRGLPCGAWFILRQKMQRSLLKRRECFNK